LAIIKSKSVCLLDKTRKELHKIVEQFELKITTEVNLNVVLYINRHSNHPPSITRQLPTAINKRIALLSSHEQTFKESTPIYQNAFRHSNFDHEFTYTHDASQRTRRNRQRNISWFNPPFSKSVNTNIGREFLSLIDKHFPLQHILHKIFNRNSLKVSYSCMSNVKSIITKHNAHIIRNSQSQNRETDNCNCDSKNTCPLPKQCTTHNIIYNATVTTNNTNDTKHYIGMTLRNVTLTTLHLFVIKSSLK
jgi:hypothetical protein